MTKNGQIVALFWSKVPRCHLGAIFVLDAVFKSSVPSASPSCHIRDKRHPRMPPGNTGGGGRGRKERELVIRPNKVEFFILGHLVISRSIQFGFARFDCIWPKIYIKPE